MPSSSTKRSEIYLRVIRNLQNVSIQTGESDSRKTSIRGGGHKLLGHKVPLTKGYLCNLSLQILSSGLFAKWNCHEKTCHTVNEFKTLKYCVSYKAIQQTYQKQESFLALWFAYHQNRLFIILISTWQGS